MYKWMAALLTAAVLAVWPATAHASVNAWNDAEPLLLVVLTVFSIVSIMAFIYFMVRDNG